LPGFKVKAGLAAIKGGMTLTEFSEQFDVYQNQIQDWKNQLLNQYLVAGRRAQDSG
jgi:transposase-like protein